MNTPLNIDQSIQEYLDATPQSFRVGAISYKFTPEGADISARSWYGLAAGCVALKGLTDRKVIELLGAALVSRMIAREGTIFKDRTILSGLDFNLVGDFGQPANLSQPGVVNVTTSPDSDGPFIASAINNPEHSTGADPARRSNGYLRTGRNRVS